jgi:tRNA-splicing ligase RtcB
MVSMRSKKRGVGQCGSLGAGNHYAEVQVVDEVYDEAAAAGMHLSKGTVVVMMHSGSRGLGHQICTEFTAECERTMEAQGIQVPDRQLACCRIHSPIGRRYLAAMKCAANFAFVNRSLMARAIRSAFQVSCLG